MAGADTTSDILLNAGYTEVTFRRCDIPILVGRDIDEAIEIVMSLGPAGEILRLAGERAADRHAEVRDALAAGLGELAREDGTIWGPASTWIVSATAAG